MKKKEGVGPSFWIFISFGDYFGVEAPPFSSHMPEDSLVAWTCSVCCHVHEHSCALFLQCGLCLSPRDGGDNDNDDEYGDDDDGSCSGSGRDDGGGGGGGGGRDDNGGGGDGRDDGGCGGEGGGDDNNAQPEVLAAVVCQPLAPIVSRKRPRVPELRGGCECRPCSRCAALRTCVKCLVGFERRVSSAREHPPG